MSSVRRLRGIFDTSLPAMNKPSPSKSLSVSGMDRRLMSQVKKFKNSSKSDLFRSSFEATIRNLATAKQFSLVEELLEGQKKYKDISTEAFTVRMISLYGKSGMYDHARKVFDAMPETNSEHTMKTFNALLSACVNSKKFNEISEITEQLAKKVGIKLDVVSYNTVIKAFCEMGSLDSALSMVDELERNGLAPNIITFNTLLDGFYKNCRFSDAEKIWDLMESKNVVPNIFSYNSKLRGMVAENRLVEAVEFVHEMLSKGVKPSVHSYNALLKGFCDDGNVEEAKKWFTELQKNGCAPDRVTYVTLVPLLCSKGDIDMACKLCFAAINDKWFFGFRIFQAVLDGLVKESKMEEAIELMELAKSKNKYYKRKLHIDR